VTVQGDLVLNRFKAHLGVFFASTLRGIVSFHYGVFAPRRPVATKYFELLYHTDPYRVTYAVRSNGVTVGLQNLSNQNFYNVHSVVPPLEEQAAIVSFAHDETERMGLAVDVFRREIALFREFRTRLIADVVTGKLDVRESAARLPDETDQPGPLDEAEALSEGDEPEDEADLHAVAGEVVA
jgi:type I restriction enzyme S subunit